MSLLEVRNLRIEYPSRHGVMAAVKDLSFTIEKGEILGVVGESGAGKSTIGNAVIDLLSPPGRIARGDVFLNGEKISGLSPDAIREIRGARIGFIFQDPMTSLNPLFTVEQQLVETMLANTELKPDEAYEKALELMEAVGIPQPELRIKQYPHQFSGGMRQRIMIAMAIALDPAVLIADEPTTALDVTVQAQIMALLEELQEERKMGLILITHDLGVVADVADRISVMYAGRIVESAGVHDLYSRPAHAYTKGLLDSIPRLDQRGQTLYAIGGLPPNLMRIPPGCPFNPRCVYATDVCRSGEPPALVEVLPRRLAACHHTKEVLADGRA